MPQPALGPPPSAARGRRRRPPAVRWAPPPGTPPHDVPQPFLLAMRSRDWAWWRPLLGLLLLAVVYVRRRGHGRRRCSAAGHRRRRRDLRDLLDLVDPWVLLVTNLSLIVAIPCVGWPGRSRTGCGIGWSSSVLARLRLAAAAAVHAAGAGHPRASASGCRCCSASLLGDEDGHRPGAASFGWLLLVVLLTTPLQSAAEEYLFRGYLSQAIAGWIRPPAGRRGRRPPSSPRRCSPPPHGPPDLPTFLDRFAFGLAASAVVWLTGGLEAAIVLHAVNNVLVFVLAGALGDGVATEEVPGRRRAAVPR